MQEANVFRNKILIGVLSKNKEANEYQFIYEKEYIQDNNSVPISVNLPLREKAFISKILFPFFFNLLSEGQIKNIQCRKLQIDENDHFTRLLETTQANTIGAITLREKHEKMS
jgi:serine/threonine-protein kinase HipA